MSILCIMFIVALKINFYFILFYILKTYPIKHFITTIKI